MRDEVIINKAASIERCVRRAKEEFNSDPSGFSSSHTRQDAATLNIQRGCEAALDMGHRILRMYKLGTPQSSRHVFDILVAAGWIDVTLGDVLKKMVGYRNIAVHDYQAIVLPITIAIITDHLDDLLMFSSIIVQSTEQTRP